MSLIKPKAPKIPGWSTKATVVTNEDIERYKAQLREKGVEPKETPRTGACDHPSSNYLVVREGHLERVTCGECKKWLGNRPANHSDWKPTKKSYGD